MGNAAAFWTGDAYPAPGATLGIGMTMGYLAAATPQPSCNDCQPGIMAVYWLFSESYG